MRRMSNRVFVGVLLMALAPGCKPRQTHIETLCETDLLFRVLDDGKSTWSDLLRGARLLMVDETELTAFITYVRFVPGSRAYVSWLITDFVDWLEMTVSNGDGGVQFLKNEEKTFAALQRPGGWRVIFFTTRCVDREGPLCLSHSGPQLFVAEMSCVDEQVVSK